VTDRRLLIAATADLCALGLASKVSPAGELLGWLLVAVPVLVGAVVQAVRRELRIRRRLADIRPLPIPTARR
jgi:hypothetical protein